MRDDLRLFLPAPAGVEACWPRRWQRCTGTPGRARARRRALTATPPGDAAEPGAAGWRSACCGRWPTAPTATSTTCTPGAPRATGRLDHAAADAARGRAPPCAARCEPELRRAAHQGRRLRHAARARHGERPSVDTRAPDLPLMLHLGPTTRRCTSTPRARPLFKRGWREDKGEAPLKETLAAAMLAAAGWQGTRRGRRRCSTPAAAPAPSPSRRRRSPAASRRALRGASPSSGCCRLPRRQCRPGSADEAPGAARACMRRRCRSSPATCPSA
jgi:hypothetical protein